MALYPTTNPLPSIPAATSGGSGYPGPNPQRDAMTAAILAQQQQGGGQPQPPPWGGQPGPLDGSAPAPAPAPAPAMSSPNLAGMVPGMLPQGMAPRNVIGGMYGQPQQPAQPMLGAGNPYG